MPKKWFKILFRRRFAVALLLILQLGFAFLLLQKGLRQFAFLSPVLHLVSAAAVLYVVNRPDTAGYKLTWSLLILIAPVFGGLFYLLYRMQSSTKKFTKSAQKIRPFYTLFGDALEEACRKMPSCCTQLSSLQDFSGFPVYDRTKTTYFPSGEATFASLLEDLKKAQSYIFMEYFIVQPGEMWNRILEILEEKAKKGVEVRLMYDDMGCLLLLPLHFKKSMEEKGIRCISFNPFRPFLTAVQNNRDHRKIAVIDGKVAYTGGVNLADEYINRIERFGHWRDAAIRLEGVGAWSLTVMFLHLWSVSTRREEEIARYAPDFPSSLLSDGFVQPYCDTPLDADHVGERVYMQMIHAAQKYLYISTPYLIIDDNMLASLISAAQSGVDVRILTPEKWDKRLVHMTTRSYYRTLLEGGVKIYEYTGGFNHAKTFVADDRIATVGTVNLDYRSLYLHFECGVKLYETESIADIKKDFLSTIAKSREMRPEDVRSNAFVRLMRSLLRLFAPLM